MRIGLNIPMERTPFLQQRRYVEIAEGLGYGDLWSSEARRLDGLTPLAVGSVWAPSMRLGTACVPVQTRGPATMAMTAAGLAEVAPGRAILGIGSSSPAIVRLWNGMSYEKPLRYTRDMIRFLRKALRNEPINEEYESFQVRFYQLNVDLPEPPKIFVAALREKMIGLAAREADGVILNMVSPEDVAKAVEIVRKHDRDVEIVVRATITPTDRVEEAQAIGRQFAGFYFSVDQYKAHQAWLGRGLEEFHQLVGEGRREEAMAALPREAVETHWYAGSADACRERVKAYAAAGVDTLIVSFLEQVTDPFWALEALSPHRIFGRQAQAAA